MARMKVEFLSHYKVKHGYTLKDRLIARLPDYAARGSRFAWLMNLRERLPGAKALGERWLGFSAKRSLPRFRRDTFWATREATMFLGAGDLLTHAAAGKKAAVLFVDTFNGTFESENAHAAARVLKAAGYALHTVVKDGGHHCCGRTYLASGMVEAAQLRIWSAVLSASSIRLAITLLSCCRR